MTPIDPQLHAVLSLARFSILFLVIYAVSIITYLSLCGRKHHGIKLTLHELTILSISLALAAWLEPMI